MGSESVICSGAQGRQSFDLNSRRACTCSAVLGFSGVPEFHSLW
uniref:PXA1 n=1 Tax=Arundo donax TaxID=35708 RepID=A0A0A9DTA2_ARUDO